ncbi:PREDICTED: uncharacterized protein LOC106792163 isoform X1 [Polistes canadensis]|uniref:uncharacterized protein LOC106792163 isoform X1 n=1 Tax=Polistes canadensis TaxID=91411 RepID=UPI000718CCD1|nr:PREDICTED: uncharacterized protein LOC106792163 isoform X1 [Polistes canadensis]
MDDLQKKIHTYLMKENHKDGELKFLTARTTIENTIKINNFSKSLSEIILAFNLVTEDTKLVLNPKCINVYKYLILNTNFTVQKRLAEDLTHGHLIDMRHTLSPYLFIQILWKLKYEDILLESIIHLPLELCIEIIDVVRRSIEELEYERAVNVIFQLIMNIYKKLILIGKNGSQSLHIEENMKSMTAHFQELLLLLSDEKIIRMEKVSDLKKYERYGLLFIRIINVVKDCIKNIGNDLKISEDTEKIYKITFGNEPIVKCEDSLITETMATLRQELMNLLLKKIKEIDCNIYLGWAELDDKDNPTITLQKTIGNECYYLVEFCKSNKDLADNEHLIECLQQLSSKPISEEINSIFTLEELRYGTIQGKKECVKELISRYKEWDETTMNCIDPKKMWTKSLLDTYDCLNLLEYLTFLLEQTSNEEYIQRVYAFVTEILIYQNIQSIYSILVEYITKHDGKNCLESFYKEEMFKEFIVRNTHMKSLTNLKIILISVLKNPSNVLGILLKIAIGYPEYDNVMITEEDLLLLSPIMSIRKDTNDTFLSSTLKTICIEDVEWNIKKFRDLLFFFVFNKLLTVNEIINNILVCYLNENRRSLRNTLCILNCTTKMLDHIVYGSIIKINAGKLFLPLARTMSSTRKRTDVSSYLINDVIKELNFLIYHILVYHTDHLDNSIKRSIVENLECILEPIEKVYFASLWPPSRNNFNLLDKMRDYERRCYFVINMVGNDQTISNELKTFLSSFDLLEEDSIRHMILRSTSSEYLVLADSYKKLFSFDLSICQSYNNFLRLTMETCSFSLEYPSLLPKHLFTFILNNCVKYLQNNLFSDQFSNPNDISDVYKSVIENIRSLDENIKRRCSQSYSLSFTTLFVCINNSDDSNNDDKNNTSTTISETQMREFLNNLELFTNQCIEFGESNDQDSCQTVPSTNISRYRLIYLFISACVEVPASKAYECIDIMNNLFTST